MAGRARFTMERTRPAHRSNPYVASCGGIGNGLRLLQCTNRCPGYTQFDDKEYLMKDRWNGILETRYMSRIAVAALLGAVGHAGAAEHSHHGNHGGSNATAEQVANSGSQVNGTLHLVQHDNSNVLIKGSVVGLTPGKHGFHIHVNGKCDSPDGMSAGGHFAPSGGAHGAPSGEAHHLGDLGNIEAGRNGVANVSVDVPGVR